MRIDARSGRIMKSYRVGRAPDQLLIIENDAWVVNALGRTVSRIHLSTPRR